MSCNIYLTPDLKLTTQELPGALYQFTVHKLRGQTHATVSEHFDGSGWQVRWSLLPLPIDVPDEVLVEQFFDGNVVDLLAQESPAPVVVDWLRNMEAQGFLG
ncbi:hypothetical protein [Luteimonas sp. MC1750]|uniref:hypothetical protein n=1 Tax=Luteimonas sp. MC1750 TaxID=2799326 RepID=UPI0018F0B886|nr:hypothetical protein [Luteimonas sp. MC1750]MBJ6984026.1 hypothetical protein [Luteimonas sp. MC1750]QQO06838.1 hypothetical protein JGR68_05270 [Luteimonas sp. MC1750]